MASASRYLPLLDELAFLRKCLLPHEFDPTGSYADEVYTRAAGYRLLAHAEFEAYIEDRVREVALTAVQAWKSKKRASRTIVALLAYSGQTMDTTPPSMRPTDPGQAKLWSQKLDFTNRIEASVAALFHSIHENHGTKENNLLRLLLPIAIDVNQIDPVLLADMNSFGERRGETAHRSASARLQLDPKDELATVEAIAKGLQDVDKLFDRLLDEIDQLNQLGQLGA